MASIARQDVGQPIAVQEQASDAELEQLNRALDHGIWYALGLWQALNVAIQNGWGGSETLEKRDWFAGAVSTLLSEQPDTDQEDVEVFLLQIMEDEFDCRVEDETEIEVAANIIRLRTSLLRDRDLSVCDTLEQRWRNRGQMKSDVRVTDQTDRDDEDDDDEEVDGNDVNNGDVEMDDAPALVSAATPRPKAAPEVDEDGFTKVPLKKRK